MIRKKKKCSFYNSGFSKVFLGQQGPLDGSIQIKTPAHIHLYCTIESIHIQIQSTFFFRKIQSTLHLHPSSFLVFINGYPEQISFPPLSAIYHQSEKHYSFSFPISSVSCDRNSKKTLSTHSTNYLQKRKKKSLPLKERTEANRAMSLHLSPQIFIMVSLFIVRGKRNCPHSYSFFHWWFIYSFTHDSFILCYQLVMVCFLYTPNHITWATVFTFWWLVLLHIHCHYSLSSKLNWSLKVLRKHCRHHLNLDQLKHSTTSVNISYDHKFLTIYKGKLFFV